MPLDVEVKGDTAAIRASARWLHEAARPLDEGAAQAHRSSGQSETNWIGAAGDGFRRLAQRLRSHIEDVVHDYNGTRDALNTHAGDLDAVKAGMDHARRVAVEGGLQVTPTTIVEPGPAPATPAALPTGRAPTPQEQNSRDAGLAAQAEHTGQVETWEQVSDLVRRARDQETESQDVLNRHIIAITEKSPLHVGSLGAGFAAASMKRTSKFHDAAREYAERADARAAAARGGDLWTHLKNTAAKDYNLFKQGEALRRATPTAWSRGVDKLPGWGKTALTYNLASPGFVPDNPGSTVGKIGTKFLSKVPLVGIGITTLGVGYDIKSGKDPWKAIAGGSSSLAAGAAVGLVVGGPVGVVVGAAVGYGVGALVESFWD